MNRESGAFHRVKSAKAMGLHRWPVALSAWALASLATFAQLAAAAETPLRSDWSGTVVYVVDGDTVHVRPLDGGKPVKIRLHGIDAPELCQPGGEASRQALARRVLDRRVVVNGKHRDDYGRLLAEVRENGDDLGGWMVGQGQAWSYRFHRHPGPYRDQQARAQASRRGVFASAASQDAQYPGDFRQQQGPCRPFDAPKQNG